MEERGAGRSPPIRHSVVGGVTFELRTRRVGRGSRAATRSAVKSLEAVSKDLAVLKKMANDLAALIASIESYIVALIRRQADKGRIS
jgi:hypothetical protein